MDSSASAAVSDDRDNTEEIEQPNLTALGLLNRVYQAEVVKVAVKKKKDKESGFVSQFVELEIAPLVSPADVQYAPGLRDMLYREVFDADLEKIVTKANPADKSEAKHPIIGWDVHIAERVVREPDIDEDTSDWPDPDDPEYNHPEAVIFETPHWRPLDTGSMALIGTVPDSHKDRIDPPGEVHLNVSGLPYYLGGELWYPNSYWLKFTPRAVVEAAVEEKPEKKTPLDEYIASSNEQGEATEPFAELGEDEDEPDDSHFVGPSWELLRDLPDGWKIDNGRSVYTHQEAGGNWWINDSSGKKSSNAQLSDNIRGTLIVIPTSTEKVPEWAEQYIELRPGAKVRDLTDKQLTAIPVGWQLRMGSSIFERTKKVLSWKYIAGTKITSDIHRDTMKGQFKNEEFRLIATTNAVGPAWAGLGMVIAPGDSPGWKGKGGPSN